MTERDIGYAIDILIACRDIDQFSQEKSLADLESDAMYQAAVLRKLEIVGEVAKRLSEGFKAKHSSISWKGWAGLRDRLIHGYDDVNLKIIFNVITEEIPRLAKELAPYESDNK